MLQRNKYYYIFIHICYIFIVNKITTILIQKREELGKSQAEMAVLLGVSRTSYAYYESGRNFPKTDFYIKYKELFGIDLPVSKSTNVTTIVAEEPTETYIVNRRKQKNTSIEFRVPLVTTKARAGYVTSYDKIDTINNLDKYAIPPGVSYTGAIWRYFEIDGDSMEPDMTTGDYVLCSQVPKDDWENVRDYYVHVLVTETELLIKRIFVKKTGQWVLISDNETAAPQRLFDVNTLKELWVFRRLIKKSISPKKKFEIKV